MEEEISDFDFEYRIITLGTTGVGKTSIIGRFVDDHFNINELSTFGIKLSFKILNVSDNKKIKLNLIDTSGQEKYRSLSASYFRNVDVVLFVFSLDTKSSFDGMQEWINTFKENNAGTYVKKMYLIGNKNDLPQNIEQNEIDEFAKKNELLYMSTSAKSKNQINELFQIIGEDLYEESKKKQESVSTKQKTLKLSNEKDDKKKCC